MGGEPFLMMVFIDLSDDELFDEFGYDGQIACAALLEDPKEEEEMEINGVYVGVYALNANSKQAAYERFKSYLDNRRMVPECVVVSDLGGWEISEGLLPGKSDARIFRFEPVFKVKREQLENPEKVAGLLHFWLSPEGLSDEESVIRPVHPEWL